MGIHKIAESRRMISPVNKTGWKRGGGVGAKKTNPATDKTDSRARISGAIKPFSVGARGE